MHQRISDMCEGPGFPRLTSLVEVQSTTDNAGMEQLRILIKDVLDTSVPRIYYKQ